MLEVINMKRLTVGRLLLKARRGFGFSKRNPPPIVSSETLTFSNIITIEPRLILSFGAH